MLTIHKNISANAISDVDSKEGIVTGYFSKFDNLDAHGDIIAKGAYKKSISENGPQGKDRILYLFMHDIFSPVGKLKALREDDFGLRFEAKLSRNTQGRDLLIMYDEGIIKEHSVGIIPMTTDKEDGNNVIRETKLIEGSAVLLGANSETPLVDMKHERQILQQFRVIEHILKTGSLSDETLQKAEDIYNSLTEVFKAAPAPADDFDESELRNILGI